MLQETYNAPDSQRLKLQALVRIKNALFYSAPNLGFKFISDGLEDGGNRIWVGRACCAI
jgi:hypothetical protein